MMIEQRYAEIRRAARRESLMTLWTRARRQEMHLVNVRALATSNRATRRATLKRAVSRMHVDDLDVAFRAALRGDMTLALHRVAPSVTRPVDVPTGTPWRLSGFLSKR
jgi:hypothetical protein